MQPTGPTDGWYVMSTFEDREWAAESGEYAPEPERVYDLCEACNGSGEYLRGDEYVDCLHCDGEGRIDITDSIDEAPYEPQSSFL